MTRTLLLLLLPAFVQAQWVDERNMPEIQPRLLLGGNASLFRISVHNFTDVYASHWGESYGGFAGLRAFGAHYITFKYGDFQQSGKSNDSIAPQSGRPLQDARWREQWYKIGLRIHPPVERRVGSYYGFGLGFYNSSEVDSLSVFQTVGQAKPTSDNSGTGFYLEIGIDYFVHKKMAAFFEVEISSGGTRGRSSFEAMSVGGWLLSVGVSVWPF